MQNHENASHHEGEHPPGKEGQAGEIFAFQEVVYPLRPEMKRWLQYFIQYLIGIGIGVIPVVAALLAARNLLNASFLWQVAIDGYVTVFAASIICLCIPRVRFVGYGLLTIVLVAMVLIFPIISSIFCLNCRR